MAALSLAPSSLYKCISLPVARNNDEPHMQLSVTTENRLKIGRSEISTEFQARRLINNDKHDLYIGLTRLLLILYPSVLYVR